MKLSNLKIKSRIPNQLLYLQVQLNHQKNKIFRGKNFAGVSLITLGEEEGIYKGESPKCL